jgi:DNA-directed RNA polymerase omega subunit
MITQPPVDELIEIAGGKYSLCTVVAKRARYLNDTSVSDMRTDLDAPVIKPISQAAQELYEGKLTITKD